MKHNKLILATLLLSPLLAFADTSENTFMDIFTQLGSYLSGSLGLVLVLVTFIGACVAIAGHAPMKVMFPPFGVCLAARYGVTIIKAVFGANSDVVPVDFYFHPRTFTVYDLGLIMLSAAVVIIGYYKHKQVAA